MKVTALLSTVKLFSCCLHAGKVKRQYFNKYLRKLRFTQECLQMTKLFLLSFCKIN